MASYQTRTQPRFCFRAVINGKDLVNSRCIRETINPHASKPLISLVPIKCTLPIVFRDWGIVMSLSLLFSQPITNLVWNRCRSAPGKGRKKNSLFLHPSQAPLRARQFSSSYSFAIITKWYWVRVWPVTSTFVVFCHLKKL